MRRASTEARHGGVQPRPPQPPGGGGLRAQTPPPGRPPPAPSHPEPTRPRPSRRPRPGPVNAPGTYLNPVDMGMFRPDGDGKPRWRGNLKQYKFGLDATGNLSLVDATGTPAISASTGFISPSAVSFWTDPSTYWANQ